MGKQLSKNICLLFIELLRSRIIVTKYHQIAGKEQRTRNRTSYVVLVQDALSQWQILKNSKTSDLKQLRTGDSHKKNS